MTDFKKNIIWAAAFLFIAALCAAVIIFRTTGSKEIQAVRILQNSEIIRTISLSEVKEPYEFNIETDDGGYNTIRVEKGKIAVTDADCPDKICVLRGFLERGSEAPVVCLPHRLSIEITDGGDVDAVAGGAP